MIRRLLIAGLAVASPLAALAAAPPPTTAPAFVVAAAQTDDYERQAGALAQQKGSAAGVRNFGQMMVTDHTKSSADVMAAAKQDGLNPTPPPLRPDQAKMLADLRGASGAAFDRAYLDQQAMVHQEALMVMRTYGSKGDKPALKAAAMKIAPVVEHHLMMVKQMQGAGK